MSVSDTQAIAFFQKCARQAGLDVSDVRVVRRSESGVHSFESVRYVTGVVELESGESGNTMDIEASLATAPDDVESPRERIEYIINWFAERTETVCCA